MRAVAGVISGGSTRTADHDRTVLALPPNPPDATRRRPCRAGAACVLALVGVAAAAWADPPDESRSAWKLRRDVTVTGGGTFAALSLPPDLAARPDLNDLRLVAADGREVAYVVERRRERQLASRWRGSVVDSRSETLGAGEAARTRRAWVVDLAEPRTFDALDLEVPGQDFAQRLKVEASDDRAAWRMLEEDASVFDQAWDKASGHRVHHTRIALREPATCRYLRLVTVAEKGSAAEVQGLEAAATRRITGEEWTRPLVSKPLPQTAKGVSRYLLEGAKGLPAEAFELSAADAGFRRTVRVLEVRERNGRRDEVLLGEASLYRLRLSEASLAGEDLRVPLRGGEGGELLLEVSDAGSPPLRNLHGLIAGPATRLLLPSEERLTLYYGNVRTRGAVYDIEALRDRIASSRSLATAQLGPEVENPAYRPEPPLRGAPVAGARLEVNRWRHVRALAALPLTDVYTLTLSAWDLGLLRPDCGDLRIADAQDRQVPFVLEADAGIDRVALEHEAEPAGTPRETRYRLTALSPLGRPVPLPISGLELGIGESFFSRPVRVVARGEAAAAGRHEGPRGSDRVLWSSVLGRSGDEQRLLILDLDGTPRRELTLVVDEGDNAPLTLQSVRALVRVPRIAFKAAPGAYRLLLGNDGAEPPHYDLTALRREVLAFSAVVATAEKAEPNPVHRRRIGDYFRQAPPTLLLWGTLVVAVGVLLALTVRLVGKTSAEPPPPPPEAT